MQNSPKTGGWDTININTVVIHAVHSDTCLHLGWAIFGKLVKKGEQNREKENPKAKKRKRGIVSSKVDASKANLHIFTRSAQPSQIPVISFLWGRFFLFSLPSSRSLSLLPIELPLHLDYSSDLAFPCSLWFFDHSRGFYLSHKPRSLSPFSLSYSVWYPILAPSMAAAW